MRDDSFAQLSVRCQRVSADDATPASQHRHRRQSTCCAEHEAAATLRAWPLATAEELKNGFLRAHRPLVAGLAASSAHATCRPARAAHDYAPFAITNTGRLQPCLGHISGKARGACRRYNASIYTMGDDYAYSYFG